MPAGTTASVAFALLVRIEEKPSELQKCSVVQNPPRRRRGFLSVWAVLERGDLEAPDVAVQTEDFVTVEEAREVSRWRAVKLWRGGHVMPLHVLWPLRFLSREAYYTTNRN